MTKPSTLVKTSIALPASFTEKIIAAMIQLIVAPVCTLQPVNTCNPKPAPAMLPMLNANPPSKINADKR